MKRILCLTILLIFLCAGTSLATNINETGFDGTGKNLQDVINGITSGGTSSVDAVGVVNDAIGGDSYWVIDGNQSAANLIIEIAGYRNINSFGIYDSANPGTKVTLFDGPDSAGAQTDVSFLLDGSVIVDASDTGVDFSSTTFGYFISNNDATFYSYTGLNGDGFDHMVAFQGTGDTITLPGASSSETWSDDKYILAWEDLNGGGDYDYQDLVVMVKSVDPVPEPATMLLFGLGVFGLGAVARKKIMN
jgi:hypothetical protein